MRSGEETFVTMVVVRRPSGGSRFDPSRYEEWATSAMERVAQGNQGGRVFPGAPEPPGLSGRTGRGGHGGTKGKGVRWLYAGLGVLCLCTAGYMLTLL